jgi:hypothetical protein
MTSTTTSTRAHSRIVRGVETSVPPLYAPRDGFAGRVLRYFRDAQPGEWATLADLVRWFGNGCSEANARQYLWRAIQLGWLDRRRHAGERRDRITAGLRLPEWRG